MVSPFPVGSPLLTHCRTKAIKGKEDILNVLNAVGGFRLEGLLLKKGERNVFEKVMRFVMDGDLDGGWSFGSQPVRIWRTT